MTDVQALTPERVQALIERLNGAYSTAFARSLAKEAAAALQAQAEKIIDQDRCIQDFWPALKADLAAAREQLRERDKCIMYLIKESGKENLTPLPEEHRATVVQARRNLENKE